MKELFVAGSGGHLMQLFLLSKRMPQKGKRIWITDRTPQSESLLENEDVVYVPHQAPRSITGLLRNSWAIRRSYSSDVSRVYSTGAGIALSAMLARPIKVAQFVYIESATRVTELSLTGKVIGRIPAVRRYVQHRQLVSARWLYHGSVLDGFRSVDSDIRGTNFPQASKKPLRVFVTVGANQHAHFDTLLTRLQNLLPKDWDTHWQYGPSRVLPQDVQGAAMMSYSMMVEQIRKADVVITHAGTGSILSVLAEGRIPVVIPRSSAAGEHVDEHQMQLATYIDQHKLGIVRTPEQITIEDIRAASRRRSIKIDERSTLDL